MATLGEFAISYDSDRPANISLEEFRSTNQAWIEGSFGSLGWQLQAARRITMTAYFADLSDAATASQVTRLARGGYDLGAPLAALLQELPDLEALGLAGRVPVAAQTAMQTLLLSFVRGEETLEIRCVVTETDLDHTWTTNVFTGNPAIEAPLGQGVQLGTAAAVNTDAEVLIVEWSDGRPPNADGQLQSRVGRMASESFRALQGATR